MPVENPTAYGLVELEPDGRVRRFLEKPGWEEVTTNTVNAGVYVLERELLEWIPKDEAYSMEREFFPLLLERGVRFFGFVSPGYWVDIGTPTKYFQAQQDLLARPVPRPRGAARARGARGLDPSRRRPSPPPRGSAGPWPSARSARSRRAPRWARASFSAPDAASAPARSSTRRCSGKRSRWARRPGSRGVSVGRGVSIGAHTRVTPGAVLGDGTRLGDYSRLAGDP